MPSFGAYPVLCSRFIFAVLFLTLATTGADAGPGSLFNRKPKTDAGKIRSLLETLKNDPNEKKRAAAANELGGSDVRLNPDVVTALVNALQKDSSPLVRSEAAESIGQLKQVFPLAGLALEGAAESDSSPAVRGAAKQALWEYHLIGYRSAKGADGIAGQTDEPPIASSPGPRPAVAFVPAPPIPVAPAPQLPVPPSPQPVLPPVVPQPGPRLPLPNLLPGPRMAIRTMLNPTPPPVLNLTAEPPIAKPPQSSPASPSTPLTPPQSPEPPIRDNFTPPSYTPTLPPFKPDLPPIVPPPS
ncbi:MAG: HEAT repeat domain-containing protein [Planctomycetia bacterium]|nr:HEAT repeat domain-containing protein [Planctomycetia bacterium]